MSASTRPATHRAEDGHRTVLIILIIGTVIAVLCALGPVWFARVGIVVAAATAILVWYQMVRSVRQMRRQHTVELTALSLRAAEEMRAERARERATLDAVNRRTDELRRTIDELRVELDGTVKELDEAYATIVVRETEIGRQRDRALQAEKRVDAKQTELNHRSAELVAATAELNRRSAQTEELRATIGRYEAELASLRAVAETQGQDGELVGLPRRVDRSVDLPEAKKA